MYYWVDRNGDPRAYSDEQLAKCSALLELKMSFSNVNSIIEAMKSVDNEVMDSILMQSYAKVGEDSENFVDYFIQLMACGTRD